MGDEPRMLRISQRDKWGHRVELDGVDISSALRGLTLEIKAGEMPKAVLDVVVEEIPTEAQDVNVWLPEEARELLVQLGWTPPVEEETA